MVADENAIPEFEFLRQTALDLGARRAKIIPTGQVFVENRVPLKCRAGCIGYGKKLTCPPHVPTPDEFRKILAEYRCALLVKFPSKAHADPDVACSLYKSWLDPDAPAEKKEKAAAFWNDYFAGSNKILPIMLELEKTAFNAGYTFALAFVGGSCRLCEICNVKAGICIHPTRARMPEHAVGINMKKTAEVAGMGIRFPIDGTPEPMAILLID